MTAELKEIIYIIADFCAEHYIPILACTNVLALLLAIICLSRTSKKRKKQSPDDFSEEVKLNLNIEKAEVKIGQVDTAVKDELSEDSGLPRESADTDDAAKPADAADTAEPGNAGKAEPEAVSDETFVVIEKLMPTVSVEAEPKEYYRSRSGRVYSKEDVLNQRKD